MKNKQKLTVQILTAMAIGIALGIMINLFAADSQWIKTWLTGGILLVGGKIFIACLKLLVVPLVLVSLISGTAALQDIRKVGTVGLKTIVLYLITTAIAISMALGFASLLRPGVGIDKDKFLKKDEPATTSVESQLTGLTSALHEVKWVINQMTEKFGLENKPFEGVSEPNEGEKTELSDSVKISSAPPLTDVIIDIFPTNPIQSMAEGNMLQIIVFSILFGLALTLSGEPGQRVLSVVNDLNEVVLNLVMLLMKTAPIGVFCLVTQTFASQGLGAIAPLSKYFFSVLLVLMIHGLITYPLFLKILSGLNPITFLKKMWQVQMFAFSTASSNATIPVTLENLIKRFGVHPSVASFTVPLGATINMDGTAIMQGVATVFIAQAWGIDLSMMDFVVVIATATLASIGTAGVPGVGLIMLSMVLLQVGLPVEGIAIILGVDRLLDMVRTAINITGDSMVTCVVGKWQNEIETDIYNGKN